MRYGTTELLRALGKLGDVSDDGANTRIILFMYKELFFHFFPFLSYIHF